MTATTLGGARPGSGPKSCFPGKTCGHSVRLTDTAWGKIDGTRGTYSRNDAIEALLRGFATTLRNVEPAAFRGDTNFPGKGNPRSIRLTSAASEILKRTAERRRISFSEILERLSRDFDARPLLDAAHARRLRRANAKTARRNGRNGNRAGS